MNLITTLIDTVSIYETNKKTHFTNLPTTNKNLKQVHIHYDLSWEFLVKITYSLLHKPESNDSIELILEPFLKLPRGITYNQKVHFNTVHRLSALLKIRIKYLESKFTKYIEGDSFSRLYTSTNEYLDSASLLGEKLCKYIINDEHNKPSIECMVSRINSLAGQFDVEIEKDPEETFINTLIAALDTKILKSVNPIKIYNATYYNHIQDPEIFKKKLSPYQIRDRERKIYAITQPAYDYDGDWADFAHTIFDPELSAIIKKRQ